MADHTDLLVIGAGPYAYSAAAYARDRGIATRIVGRPMAFWRDQMPADMYLRSGPDWHLDARARTRSRPSSRTGGSTRLTTTRSRSTSSSTTPTGSPSGRDCRSSSAWWRS